MSNWYFNCPECEDEIGCDVTDHVAPDGRWSTVDYVPDECPTCGQQLLTLDLEDMILEQWNQRNVREWEPEDEDELTLKAYWQ